MFTRKMWEWTKDVDKSKNISLERLSSQQLPQ